jgi:tetratricopeptide (TPR) repeat protein
LSKIGGQEAAAIDQYKILLRFAPASAAAHRELGKLLAKAGRRQEALEHLETAERVAPDPDIAAILQSLRLSS